MIVQLTPELTLLTKNIQFSASHMQQGLCIVDEAMVMRRGDTNLKSTKEIYERVSVVHKNWNRL